MAFGQYTGMIGSVVGGIIGGVLGTYFPVVGTAAGAALGASVGGAIGGVAGQVFWPERAEINAPPPPLPNERAQQISTYGATRPMVWGSKRMAGNIIAMSDIALQTVRTRHRQNGVRYYEMTTLYTATFAIAFCEGPVTGISRLWVNGQIFADFRDATGTWFPTGTGETATGNLNTSLARQEQYFTIHLGDETQTADPDLEAVFGAGTVPAYRGTCYVVFIDFPVGETQGIPTIEAEIVAAGTAPTDDYALDLSAYAFSAHQSVDLEGNLVKFDTVTRRVHVFRGISETLLRSFAVSAPSSYSFQGMGVEPITGYLLLGFDNGLAGSSDRVVHYAYSTEGDLVTSWQDDTIYGTGDSGVFYCWTTEGLVVHYSTTAYYAGGWSYGAKMVLYRNWDSSEQLDAVWGPIPDAGSASPSWARYLPIFGIRPDYDAYIYMPKDGVYYKWKWSEMTRYATGGLTYGVMPVGALVSADLRDAESSYAGATMDDAGRLLTFDTVSDELHAHVGISNTRTQRVKILESAAGLDDVVTAICAAAGIGSALIDVTALASDDVLGYYVPRQMPARTALELLMTAYSFDAAEIDWKLVFVKRGGASAATILVADLASREGSDPAMDEIVETRATDLELPTHLLLTYESKVRDYQLATQSAVRVDRPLYRMNTQQFGLVMTDEHAKRTAEILLKQLWQRRAYSFTTTHKWLKLAPCDVVTVAGKDMRIVGMTDRQGVVEFQAEAEPGGTYTSSALAQDLAFALVDVNAAGFVPNLLVMEIPPIDSTVDPALCVVYAALYGVPALFNGGIVRLSLDSGVTWTDAGASDATTAKVGSVATALGTGTHGALDYTSSITVDFSESQYTPASATDAALAGGANLLAVGLGSSWELLQFKTATQVSGYQYTLTGLLRGLYGSEWMTAAHVANERAVLLTGLAGMVPISVPVSSIGSEIILLAALASGSTGGDQALTVAGVSLETFAPSDVTGSRDSSSNLTIAWKRADRREFAYPDLMDYADEAPLSEASESYEVDVVNPITGLVARTITATSRTAAYTAAMQTTDAYPGQKLFCDCSGTFTTYFANRSVGCTCEFNSGRLRMATGNVWNTYAPAAEFNYVIPRSGKYLVGFKWLKNLYLNANALDNGASGVFLTKQTPTYATAAWAYNRPEYGVGNNSFLLLAFVNAGGSGVSSGAGQLKIVQRVSGSDTVLATSIAAFDWKLGTDPKAYTWEIDFTNHAVRVLADGVEIIASTAFSATIDAQLGSNCQAVIHANYYGDTIWHYWDDIGVYSVGAGAWPVTVDVYQLSALTAIDRGTVRRAYL
jgi:hypothetical protein